MTPIQLSTHLARSADEVWSRVATPKGVNAELMPLVRMTFPRGASLTDLPPERMGTPVAACWLLALGLIPFDRHVLVLDHVGDRSFSERSHSLMQREWRHDRSVTPDGDGCILTDRVKVLPRLPFLAAPTRWIVGRIFAHRHKRLRQLFGE